MPPQLTGLQGYGLLELIADRMLPLHREPGCDPRIEESAMVECHVVNNRHGQCTLPAKLIRLVLSGPFARFSDLP